MRLSRWDGEVTRLHPRQVKASNWLPGTLETVYSCWSDLPRLAEQIAVTEHVAEQTGLHPSALCWNGEAVSSTHLPCNQLFPVVRRLDGALEVRDGEERLDVSNLRDWWRERLCQDDPWPGETLLFALLERFVRRVVVADPAGLAACKRRSALFLANHQVGIESILFNVLASALIELPLTVVAKAEHRDTWIGRLIGAFESWPGIDLPPSIFFFDRSDQSSLVNALPHLTTRTGRHETALLVHAAGTRSVVCPDPIRQLSAVFVDLALGADLPVIPVRFMGGLPHADSGNRKRLELPVGSHGQDIIIGSPIAADKLKGMPLGERKDFILDVLNRLGPPAAQEQPNATDRAFDAHLSELVSTYHLSELQAAIVAALESSRQSQGEQLAGALLSATPAQGGPALEALRQWFRSMSPPRTPPARSTAR
jgi:1-acyl-sn-glycerol-3-phosphate acyltransferase